MIDDLREQLHKAGSTFDGRVTNGSLEAQMVVVRDAIAAAIATYSEAYFAAMCAAYECSLPKPTQATDEDVKK